MNKDFGGNLSLTLIGGLFSIGIGVAGYFAYKLDSQSTQFAKLDKKVAILLVDFSKKNPNINVEALIDYANAKNISTNMTSNAVQVIQENPLQGKLYLEEKLKFNPSEIDSVMQKPGVAPSNRTGLTN